MREKKNYNISQIRWLILYTILLLVLGLNYKSIFEIVGKFFRLLLPFLLGGAIAFVLNVPMRFAERFIRFRKGSRLEKLRRPLSLVTAIILVLIILSVVVFIVAPQLGKTALSLTESIPNFFARVRVNADAMFQKYPEIVDYINQFEIDWKKTIEDLLGFLSTGASSVLNSTLTAAVSIVSAVTTFGIGFIFAIYILLQKEDLKRQVSKVLYAYLPEKMADEAIRVASMTERIFSKFLTGQCVEAVILGSMFFLVLSLLDLPYPLLIGVLIAFTALIPVFGAFIGCAVGIFLTLIISPAQAFWFTMIFLGLQQLEGNLIYPYVVGNSVGLPSIWVLVAVTLGGSTMGIVGMLIFIPLSSVAYALFRERVNARLIKRGRLNTICAVEAVPNEEADHKSDL